MDEQELIQAALEALKPKVVASTAYIDIPAQLRASRLLGQATEQVWKKAVASIKKMLEPEMKREVARLKKWGTVEPSEAHVKEVIKKILIKNGIPTYPELVYAIYQNPFQTRGVIPEGRSKDKE